MGPDWLSGLELKGKTRRRIIMENEVEVSSILEPEEIKKQEIAVTHLNPEEGKHICLPKCLWEEGAEVTSIQHTHLV